MKYMIPLILLIGLLSPLPASGLEELGDKTLSEVSGQAGVILKQALDPAAAFLYQDVSSKLIEPAEEQPKDTPNAGTRTPAAPVEPAGLQVVTGDAIRRNANHLGSTMVPSKSGGVSLIFDITMDIQIDAISWGDMDGLGDGNTSAGYIGLSNLNVSGLRINTR